MLVITCILLALGAYVVVGVVGGIIQGVTSACWIAARYHWQRFRNDNRREGQR